MVWEFRVNGGFSGWFGPPILPKPYCVSLCTARAISQRLYPANRPLSGEASALLLPLLEGDAVAGGEALGLALFASLLAFLGLLDVLDA